MKKFCAIMLATLWLHLLGSALFAGEDVAQQPAKTLTGQFVGTWTLVELFYTTQDGTRVDSLGSDPKGRLRLDADGTFTLQIMRSGLPKFKSNNREQGTAGEKGGCTGNHLLLRHLFGQRSGQNFRRSHRGLFLPEF